MQTKPLTLRHRTTILLDDEERARLAKLSGQTGIPLSALIRRALGLASDRELCGLVLDDRESPAVRRGALDQYMRRERE